MVYKPSTMIDGKVTLHTSTPILLTFNLPFSVCGNSFSMIPQEGNLQTFLRNAADYIIETAMHPQCIS